MPKTLKNIQKIGNRWYSDYKPFSGAISANDGYDYWIGTDGSKTFLKSTDYKPTEEIKNYIKQKEAFRPNWYQDGNGYWTIGYGFKDTPELRRKYPKSMSKEQADQLFDEMLPQYVNALKRSTPRFNSYNQNQLDALLSYIYNIGETGFTTKSPNLQKALRERNIDNIVSNIDFGYNDEKNPGLKTRRNEEREWFNRPVTKVPFSINRFTNSINHYKQGGNIMNKLMPRKQKGGLIPKFQNSGKFKNKFEEYKATHQKGKDSVDNNIYFGKVLPEVVVVAPAKKQGTASTQRAAGGTRSTALPAVSTNKLTDDMNASNADWLKARNDAMTRGYRDYYYDGKRYSFEGDDLKNAQANWRINRGRLNANATGLQGILSADPTKIAVTDDNTPLPVKPEDQIVEPVKPDNTLNTPYTYWYSQGTNQEQRNKLAGLTDLQRNGQLNLNAKESDGTSRFTEQGQQLISSLASANQNSARNYIQNLWNTPNDVATRQGRENYVKAQGLDFAEPFTSTILRNRDLVNKVNQMKLDIPTISYKPKSAKRGAKLLPRKR